MNSGDRDNPLKIVITNASVSRKPPESGEVPELPNPSSVILGDPELAFSDPPEDESEPLIRLENVSVRFGTNPVLRKIDLSVSAGETVAVIGESGCGKTVLLKTLIGLHWPTEGRVVFDENNLAELSYYELAKTRTRYGFVFQQAALFDSMTIGENVAFPLVQHTTKAEDEIREIVEHLLNEVGLSKQTIDKKPAELSGGMRKRVGFARALALEPELVLYDEPTTGLDPIMSDVINELILGAHARYNVTGIMVTHDMRSAFKVADRIVMLYPLARLDETESQIIFDGTPEALRLSKDRRVQQFLHGDAGERLVEKEE